MSNKSKDQRTRERRKRVIVRLESQLKAGTKPEVDLKSAQGHMIPLTTHDEKRIKKELATLAERV
jgi:hypothetical protein